MKTFINSKGEEYLFIEVPLDAYDFCIFPDGTRYIVIYFLAGVQQKGKIVCEYSKNEPKIISTTKDITEEITESIVELIGKNLVIGKEKTYKDYHPRDPWYKDSAKSSLYSLITSLGLDINKNYLILKKI